MGADWWQWADSMCCLWQQGTGLGMGDKPMGYVGLQTAIGRTCKGWHRKQERICEARNSSAKQFHICSTCKKISSYGDPLKYIRKCLHSEQMWMVLRMRFGPHIFVLVSGVKTLHIPANCNHFPFWYKEEYRLVTTGEAPVLLCSNPRFCYKLRCSELIFISKTCFLIREIHNFHGILIDFIESPDPTESDKVARIEWCPALGDTVTRCHSCACRHGLWTN